MVNQSSTCKRDGCEEPRVKFSVFCLHHHSESLKAFNWTQSIPPNANVADALRNPELVEAVLVWTGRKSSPFPRRDDEAIRAKYGENRSAEILQILELMYEDFYTCNARYVAQSLAEMESIAVDEFKERYPNVPLEVANAFAWCYTFDNR